MNKKRIIITLIIVICILLSFLHFINTNTKFIQGKAINRFVKETDVEFDIENDAHLKNLPVIFSGEKNVISKGTHVRVLQELNKWVQITDGTNIGWVIKQNILTVEDVLDVPTLPTNNLDSNEVENQPIVNETNNVSNNTNTVKPDTSNVGKMGVVNVDTARVREAPDGKMMGLVDLNDTVEILAEEGEWYKANIDEYKNCYIAKRLVTIK